MSRMTSPPWSDRPRTPQTSAPRGTGCGEEPTPDATPRHRAQHAPGTHEPAGAPRRPAGADRHPVRLLDLAMVTLTIIGTALPVNHGGPGRDDVFSLDGDRNPAGQRGHHAHVGQARGSLRQEEAPADGHRDLRDRLRRGGSAPSIGMLVVARVIQGVGMGGLTAG
ncbi:hypothetical protein QJS66_02785 [Kocuria rhizophila]|nr:hypothetical protein QJS66_02785 [Kocuria rhizophila]